MTLQEYHNRISELTTEKATALTSMTDPAERTKYECSMALAALAREIRNVLWHPWCRQEALELAAEALVEADRGCVPDQFLPAKEFFLSNH